MTRLWEELRVLLMVVRFLAFGPVLWVLDRVRPEKAGGGKP